jgi:hypothetical protein
MKPNEYTDVHNASQSEPSLTRTDTCVIMKDAVLTITNKLDNYNNKLEAAYDAKRVYGDNQLASAWFLTLFK